MKSFQSRYQWDKFAWSIAAAAGVLTVGAVYFVLATVNDIRHHLAHQSLAAELAERDYTTARQALKQIIALPTGMAWFDLWSLRDREIDRVTNALWELMLRITEQNYAAAADTFGLFLTKHQETIFQILGPRALEETKSALDAAIAQLEQESKIQKNYDQLSERRAAVIRQHSLVAKDLGDIVALPSVYSVTRLNEDMAERTLEYYRSGVLAQLPSIKGLPDGLRDIDAFREALEAAGGHITIGTDNPALDQTGTDAATAFQSAIAALRDTSAGLISQDELLSAQREEISLALQEQAALVGKDFDRVQRRLSDLLIRLTAPDPVKEQRRAREAARESSLGGRSQASPGIGKYLRDRIEDAVRTVTSWFVD